ncbi:MAG: DUF6157 family protein [Saprospiraceae bacterium]|nr:DUF6157 family protein [Saprospiraceae bacterium]
MHTTNYYNTLIEIAEDCPAANAEEPPVKNEEKTVARLQFEMILEHPYQYSSDDVIFGIFAARNGMQGSLQTEREQFFSRGQACMRSSPLPKRYGWGVHHNGDGKVAIYPVDSEEYRRLAADPGVKKVKAMRSKR